MNPGYVMGWFSGFFDQLRTNVDSDHAARQFVQALETDDLAIVHRTPGRVDLDTNCAGTVWGGDDQ